MLMGAAFLSQGAAVSGLLRADEDLNLGVNGFLKYEIQGQTIYLTTTHISILIIMGMILVFAIIANRAIKKADPTKEPGTFMNIVELLVESIDKLTVPNMGAKYGPRFSNYIGALFMFIFCSNISGLLGLRPPTADYSVTLALALMTFVIIHFNGFKHQKLKHVTDLFHPLLLTPINIIGEFAVPVSMSLRLFGNIMSGTVMMTLVYGLIPKVLTLVWPSVLHAYFDLFSGAIQSYVFCMLTMVFTKNAIAEED